MGLQYRHHDRNRFCSSQSKCVQQDYFTISDVLEIRYFARKNWCCVTTLRFQEKCFSHQAKCRKYFRSASHYAWRPRYTASDSSWRENIPQFRFSTKSIYYAQRRSASYLFSARILRITGNQYCPLYRWNSDSKRANTHQISAIKIKYCSIDRLLLYCFTFLFLEKCRAFFS